MVPVVKPKWNVTEKGGIKIMINSPIFELYSIN